MLVGISYSSGKLGQVSFLKTSTAKELVHFPIDLTSAANFFPKSGIHFKVGSGRGGEETHTLPNKHRKRRKYKFGQAKRACNKVA